MTSVITRLACAAALTLAAGHVSAATIFTDRSAWEAAAGGMIATETFDANIASATMITFDGGITATMNRPASNLAPNEVANGAYNGFAQLHNFRNITFDFGEPVTAFGADFSNLLPSVPNSTLVTGIFDGLTEQTFAIASIVNASAGFFGIVGTAEFSSILFSTDRGVRIGANVSGGRFIRLDNFSTATLADAGSPIPDAVAPIPLPASALLLVSALGAIGAMRSRRKRRN